MKPLNQANIRWHIKRRGKDSKKLMKIKSVNRIYVPFNIAFPCRMARFRLLARPRIRTGTQAEVVEITPRHTLQPVYEHLAVRRERRAAQVLPPASLIRMPAPGLPRLDGSGEMYDARVPLRILQQTHLLSVFPRLSEQIVGQQIPFVR